MCPLWKNRTGRLSFPVYTGVLEELIIETGYDCIPKPIRDFVRNNSGSRPSVPNLYHVSGLVYCLGKEFYKRTINLDQPMGIEGQFNVFRGKTYDGLFSPLFELNQKTSIVTRDNVSITGTHDFIYDGYLWDLKMPKSVYYKIKNGAGQGYIRQVKSYLAMNHSEMKLIDITKARILMIAGDGVAREEVEADDDKGLLDWLFARAIALNKDVKQKKIEHILEWSLPEEDWECNPDYCQYSEICPQRKEDK